MSYDRSSVEPRRSGPRWPRRISPCPGVLRSKGFFWLATRPRHIYSWSHAGACCRYEVEGHWWAALDPDDWPESDSERQEIRADWDDRFGDRRQELVFLGVGMDRGVIESRLDACLLNDAEIRLDLADWESFPDPFPALDSAAEVEDAD